jgi:two-component system response regulator MprA
MTTSGTRARVLVVDDEPPVRQALAEYLGAEDFEVLEAGDGQEAIDRVPEFRAHIVLLDVSMPRLSGVETLRRIRALNGETCVLMISGLDDEDTARQTLAMGAADYLTKPVNYAYLVTVLKIHLLRSQFEPEASSASGAAEQHR